MSFNYQPLVAVTARLDELASGLPAREQKQLDKHWKSLPLDERLRCLSILRATLNDPKFVQFPVYIAAFPAPPTDVQIQRCASFFALVYQKKLIKDQRRTTARLLAGCKKLGTPVFDLPTFTKQLDRAKPGGALIDLNQRLLKSQRHVMQFYNPARAEELLGRDMPDADITELTDQVCKELGIEKD